jgi:hypothetical protein
LDLLALSKYRCSVPKAAAAKKTPSPAGKTSSQIVSVPHEAIALRAYQAFLKRGCIHGLDLDDWLEAERELLKEYKTKPRKPKKSEPSGVIVH